MMIGDKEGGQLSRFNLNNKLVQKIFHGLFSFRVRKLNKHKEDGSWNNTWGMKINPLPVRKESVFIRSAVAGVSNRAIDMFRFF